MAGRKLKMDAKNLSHSGFCAQRSFLTYALCVFCAPLSWRFVFFFFRICCLSFFHPFLPATKKKKKV